MHLQPNLTGLENLIDLLCSDPFNSVSEFLLLICVILVSFLYEAVGRAPKWWKGLPLSLRKNDLYVFFETLMCCWRSPQEYAGIEELWRKSGDHGVWRWSKHTLLMVADMEFDINKGGINLHMVSETSCLCLWGGNGDWEISEVGSGYHSERK